MSKQSSVFPTPAISRGADFEIFGLGGFVDGFEEGGYFGGDDTGSILNQEGCKTWDDFCEDERFGEHAGFGISHFLHLEHE